MFMKVRVPTRVDLKTQPVPPKNISLSKPESFLNTTGLCNYNGDLSRGIYCSLLLNEEQDSVCGVYQNKLRHVKMFAGNEATPKLCNTGAR